MIANSLAALQAARDLARRNFRVERIGMDSAPDWSLHDGALQHRSRAFQRIGRAGHRLDLTSRALLVPANRFEVLECRAALDAVCEIPYGAVASYADVAVAARRPGANRAVGTACARTPISIILPAHRVVRSDGSIGEYGGHPERKRFLLDLEEEVLRRAGGHEGSASV